MSLFEPTEQHAQLRDVVRLFTEKEVEPQASSSNRKERFNHSLFKKLGDLGLLGITVPEEFGGSGMDAVAAVIAHEELASSDPAFCLSYLAHSILFANNLAVNGNNEQCEKYLPPVCSGEKIAGMCMSEANAGTDVLGMTTVSKPTKHGYELNGQKMWITNGYIEKDKPGDLFLVYAKNEVIQERSLSLFIVESSSKGFQCGQMIRDKLGMRASPTAELIFDHIEVPTANLVGKQGDALKSMMRNLAIERLTLAAMSLGIARRSIEIMNRYAAERKAFNQPINRFGQIQAMIADSYSEYMAGRSYVYQVAHSLDLRAFGNRIDSDGVKLFCARMATTVANRAIQVLGGYGYVGDYVVERLWRDARLLEIGGGTNEAHQKNMARDLSRLSRLQ